MKENHYILQYSAEDFGSDVMGTVDPFCENQRSKSQEHKERLSFGEKSQKITEIEENKS